MTSATVARRRLSMLLALLFFPEAAQAAPKVVVTIKPVHALVSQIMEGVGVPTLIVDGAASPHTFTLKPSTAEAIQNADVFIRVSAALEPFTRKITSSLPSSVKVLTLAEAPGVVLLDQRRGGAFEPHMHETDHEDAAVAPADAEHHDHDEDVEGKDGHIWLDPENAEAIVAEAAKVLEARYPDDAGRLVANAKALELRLDDLTREIKHGLEPVRKRPFIVFHDATQYFESRFGLGAAGSITVSPDVPPSARRLSEVRQKILALGAICVFSEPSFQPKLSAAVTEGTKARAGTLDAEGQLLKAGPDLYFELMRGLARNLSDCLKG